MTDERVLERISGPPGVLDSGPSYWDQDVHPPHTP